VLSLLFQVELIAAKAASKPGKRDLLPSLSFVVVGSAQPQAIVALIRIRRRPARP
jgi:hypothetical protein